MKKITLERIAEPENLKFAFNLITKHAPSYYVFKNKQWFKNFRSNKDKNIDLLSEKIKNGYQPVRPLKIYHPKSVLNTRIFTLLNIKDDIVYQSILNLVARNAYGDLKNLQGQISFASPISKEVTKNFKNKKNNSNRMFYSYKDNNPVNDYNDFIKRSNDETQNLLNEWKLDTDVTSFFDSIPLRQLINALKKYRLDNQSRKLLHRCLSKWSGTKDRSTKNIGIPTGPFGSSFLANLFLHEIDMVMITKPVVYLRYMDDFKIFAKNEKSLEKVGSKLSTQLRGIGLSLKSSKTDIEEIDRTLLIRPSITGSFGYRPYIDLDEHGNPKFKDRDSGEFIENRKYQLESLKELKESAFNFFTEKENGDFDIINEEKFFKKKLDAELSKILRSYRLKMIECHKRKWATPDENFIDLMFYLCGKIFNRIHVYIPFLGSIFKNNLKVRDRLFVLLENRMNQNMEVLRVIIYSTLRNFNIKPSQSEKLLSMYKEEETYASELLYDLLVENCYKNNSAKKDELRDYRKEKISEEFFDDDKLSKKEVIIKRPSPKNRYDYEKHKSLCEKLLGIEFPYLSKKDKKIIEEDLDNFKKAQSVFLNERYKDKYYPDIIDYITRKDRHEISVNDLKAKFKIETSEFWRASILRAMVKRIPNEKPNLDDTFHCRTVESDEANPPRSITSIKLVKRPIFKK